MLTIQDKLVLKRRVHLQSGEQTSKTFTLLRCRHHTPSFQIYDIYDNEINQELTLKMVIKTQQLSKQQSINEIKNHQLFCHMPQFISLYDIYEDTNCIYLIMQKWGVTLAEVISIRQTFTQYEVQLIFSQILDSIVQLRKKNIAHGFIRLESVFIDIKETHRIKLGEFNRSFNVGKYFQSLSADETNHNSSETHISQLSQKLLKNHQNSSLNNQYSKSSTAVSSKTYMSPEQLKFIQQKHLTDYSTYLSALYQNDLWALGVLIYRLLIGRFPFQGQQPQKDMEFLSKKEDKKKFINRLSSKSEGYKSIQTLIKQCCYSFDIDGNQISFHEENQTRISQHFEYLIKCLLKPIGKRITLKELLVHPLKLRSYDNVRQIDLGSSQSPLGICNTIQVEGPLGLKRQIIQRHGSKILKNEDNCQHDLSERKAFRNLTALPDYPQFSLFTDDSRAFLSMSSLSEKSAYAYSWELNFDISTSLEEEQGPVKQKKQTQQFYIQNPPKLKQALKAQHNSKCQSNSMDQNVILSRSGSSHNFNIRNINMNHSKKQIDFNVKQIKNYLKEKPKQQQIQFTSNYQIQQSSKNQNKFFKSLDQINQKEQTKKIQQIKGTQFPTGKYSLSDQIKENNFKKQTITNRNQNSPENKNKQKQINLNQLNQAYQNLKYTQWLILKTQLSTIPLILEEPEFISQYKYQKSTHSLGYVLNNGVGIIFSSGKHIMGHNQTDFVLLSKNKLQNSDYNSNQFCPSPSNIFKNNFTKNNDQSLGLLSFQEEVIYKNFLKFFGKRMVISNFSLWVVNFWQEGRTFIFLINNGSWQVTFQGKKTSRFFIIDQNSLLWTKGKYFHKPQILNRVRKIVEEKKIFLIKSKQGF